MTKKILKIEQIIFLDIFAADGGFRADLEGLETYLDRTNGTLITAVADPVMARMRRLECGESLFEDYLENTAEVKKQPERYLEVPVMSHGQHHQVIQRFLDSPWTESQERRDHAANVYYPRKSIGCWLDEVGDQDAIDQYRGYRTREEFRLAEDFLRRNGIADFEWK